MHVYNWYITHKLFYNFTMQINDFKIILKLYKKVLDQYIYSHILEGGENTAK